MRLTQIKLATESDVDGFVKKTNFDDKLRRLNNSFTSNKKNTQRLKRK